MEKINVLIVEDQDFLIEGICNFIESLDQYSVVGIAKNGVDALQVAEVERIDVLITTLNVPLMSSIELSEKLKIKNADLKVLVLVDKNRPVYISRYSEAGIKAFISSNANCSDMENALEAINDNLPYISNDIKEHIIQ